MTAMGRLQSFASFGDSFRCITAAQSGAATVRFGSKGHSGATYQLQILDNFNTDVLKTLFITRCLNI
jgi:hypothetical protein